MTYEEALKQQLSAIKRLVKTLTPLDAEARAKVMAAAAEQLGGMEVHVVGHARKTP